MTLKLFVADDSPTIHKVIRLAFSDTDSVIECVTEGESALEAILVFRPDVVLADVCMPGVSGYELCSLIKSRHELSHTPVVLLAGTFEPFDEAEAVRVQYDACLTKPFNTSELVEVVRRLLGRHAMSQEIESDMPSNGVETKSTPDATVVGDKVWNARIPISRQSLESFLGSSRILDVFDAESASNAASLSETGKESTMPDSAENPPPPAVPVTPDFLSEEVLDTIVERVVKKMSSDVVSEIAWEIVPELSEILIRRSIEETRNP